MGLKLFCRPTQHNRELCILPAIAWKAGAKVQNFCYTNLNIFNYFAERQCF